MKISGVPYTIIKIDALQDTRGGKQVIPLTRYTY